LRFEDADEERVMKAAQEMATAANQTPSVRSGQVKVLGPAPAPLARLRGRFRYQLLLRSKDRRPLRACLLGLLPLRDRLGARVRIVIDVDPVQMM
jgi:primosomal protein N' (replication factor Y)